MAVHAVVIVAMHTPRAEDNDLVVERLLRGILEAELDHVDSRR